MTASDVLFGALGTAVMLGCIGLVVIVGRALGLDDPPPARLPDPRIHCHRVLPPYDQDRDRT